ncbi:hypothetical protein HanPI659440_Chr11g0413141 [Helianthus annuus]|nr:hypothetical protein HanPI659440_Chr11g0413141 [Helianthus annuus]
MGESIQQPKVEVMKYLKSKPYTDAKDSAGECVSVVIIARDQSMWRVHANTVLG